MAYKNFISWNYRYFKAVNSCSNNELDDFFDEVLNMNPRKGFKRKIYFWNIIRGKSFYISAARYVSNRAKASIEALERGDDPETQKHLIHLAEQMIDCILESEKRQDIRESFIWNICKHVPILTIRTIPYLSQQRIRNILSKEDNIFNDEALNPFIEIIRELRETNQNLVDTFTKIGG